MDVLVPFVEEFYKTHDIELAISVAQEAAENTRKLTPKLGRATYVGIDDQTEFPPDPGAYGVYEIIRAFQLINHWVDEPKFAFPLWLKDYPFYWITIENLKMFNILVYLLPWFKLYILLLFTHLF